MVSVRNIKAKENFFIKFPIYLGDVFKLIETFNLYDTVFGPKVFLWSTFLNSRDMKALIFKLQGPFFFLYDKIYLHE